MRRKFEPFDKKIIRREILSLSSQDHKRLTVAMKAYQLDLGVGYKLKNYGNQIEMLTDSGDGQGRCIFFTRSPERLIVLLIYKKESQKIPASILEITRARLRRFITNE
ncbi:MAG: type II toxin-antitoxin system RelE/ParE family toxin [Fimbriimonadaceae bacterium]